MGEKSKQAGQKDEAKGRPEEEETAASSGYYGYEQTEILRALDRGSSVKNPGPGRTHTAVD